MEYTQMCFISFGTKAYAEVNSVTNLSGIFASFKTTEDFVRA